MENFIKKITRQAGDLILKRFKIVGVKHTKANPADVVTEADLEANHFLVNEIKKKYPSHGIISEELGEENTDAEYVWLIDPLDGTRNFASHVPIWGTMVGLLRNNKMYMAVVYDPSNKELVFASNGRGAFMNDKKIKCSTEKNIAFSYGVGSATYGKFDIERLKSLVEKANKQGGFGLWMNDLGSSAIGAIYTATGRRDWKMSQGAQIWDYAIPALILQEAGCKVTTLDGKIWQFGDREILAANPVLLKKILKAI
jgi:myo-inositol-1(or 4)-monophosphatase